MKAMTPVTRLDIPYIAATVISDHFNDIPSRSAAAAVIPCSTEIIAVNCIRSVT